MKTSEVNYLKEGDKVEHKQFGVCTVKGHIPQFGPTIVPDTPEGQQLLTRLSGMPAGTPYLASDYKQNLKRHV